MCVCYISYLHLYNNFDVIMNRHGRHNIRIGILWAQTSHSQCTCTAHIVYDRTLNTPTIRILQKKKIRGDEIRIRIC